MKHILYAAGFKFGVDERAIKHFNIIAYKFNLNSNKSNEYIIKRLNAITEVGLLDRDVRNKDVVKIELDDIKLRVNLKDSIIEFVALYGEEGELFHNITVPQYKIDLLRRKYEDYGISFIDSSIFIDELQLA